MTATAVVLAVGKAVSRLSGIVCHTRGFAMRISVGERARRGPRRRGEAFVRAPSLRLRRSLRILSLRNNRYSSVEKKSSKIEAPRESKIS